MPLLSVSINSDLAIILFASIASSSTICYQKTDLSPAFHCSVLYYLIHLFVFIQSDGAEIFSTLEYLDFWMRSIFAHASTINKKDPDNKTFSPPVLIVGTHKDCLNTEADSLHKIVSFLCFVSLDS